MDTLRRSALLDEAVRGTSKLLLALREWPGCCFLDLMLLYSTLLCTTVGV
jgi:hypothetical protein